MPRTPAMMIATRFLMIPPGWLTPMEHRPMPAFHVPHAAPQLARTMQSPAPMNPLCEMVGLLQENDGGGGGE